MKIENTIFEEVKIIIPQVFEDNRGFFMESYNASKLEVEGLKYSFIQDNHSLSTEVGVIRGLHYQLSPKAQTKMIRVIRGAIFDVVVDIRKQSPTFGEWFGIELSSENKKQLLIPKGFAHGFCTLAPDTEVIYKVDELYSPELDRGIMWNDSDINIKWPINNPILSIKDQNHPNLKDAEVFA
ncbi:TPA: dTDP-4-dehydrorhamnose 3,5-epimerase [Bacillus toyonensis]|uniref:dTDP-4-dehydrorhamnose 3,5-epimerase n=1 Tax=Bacillus toyonensis TaxID=155322 RepID=UPI000BF1156D|nr:dTDP-4-dehydrorhamnose 3,5-epimerase [Bacillus toyonensis]PEO66115.1 dTDP-4-dehydrorhamnose 3,5-epimerase [Bacillus toyonensis]PFX76643.1 dTDP-4-dehydrorhamnose 3,5-epimerase [Bacillus toyonensis]PFX88634.1 dTDP-4-dehydrorhamnose 3,5-epimerase [Bacillus toyonensis]PGB06555.1 dTDP-4-dehydrorhamnose 3,5-epimerase [Bacillus toyonensis]PHB57868.1 dTDP-4-dehydrorhamnose 3,5-epimerase [Bacillus toyonensis]